MCGMMECGHSPTSLEERARELKLEDVSKMIHAASNGKVRFKFMISIAGNMEYTGGHDKLIITF